jgi:UTP--glucose-1-phosphate uridylyltransferase
MRTEEQIHEKALYQRSRSNPLVRRAPLRDRVTPQIQEVRKAVFPVAGLDTGFLPATKAAPKEMLTIVDKPLIHYAVEEAIAAGIKEMIFVTSRNKRAIEDHFDMAYELESMLSLQSREEVLSELRRQFPPDVKYLYVRQRECTSLGAAILCARPLVGNEPFAVILPDELIDGVRPAIAQVVDAYKTMKQPVIGARRGSRDDGPADVLRTGAAVGERSHHVVRLERYEAPPPGELVAAGRFVLTPAIFQYLERSVPAGGADADLADALRAAAAEESLAAYEVEGDRFACGTKLGLLAANIHYGLKHPELGVPFREMLRRLEMRQPGAPPAFQRARPQQR